MGEKLRIFAVAGFALIVRWCVTYHSYSGQGESPMYGDYEAQRHWQEITTNLPIRSWYTNDSVNDMQYWGLDYPPLTAYHSLLMGRIAKKIDPRYVELIESRGYESPSHKYFMRLSVIVVDALIYVPSMIFFVRRAMIHDGPSSRADASNPLGLKKNDFILALSLLYPGIILIDHGHFQYNCVSLGLFVAAAAFLLQNYTIISSLLFVLALNYKQMELYHALPFFFYILGNNTPSKRKTILSCARSLLCVSLTVILTFIVIWAPFIQQWDVFKDALARLFPLDRGIYEDKVANLWCTINVLQKFRDNFTNLQMARVCLVATSLAIFPSCLDLYLRPHRERFIVSLINCSLGFYLLSFQVHEKTILLAAIPVLMYLNRDPLICFWFLIITNFSLLPLMIKDHLVLPYFSLSLLYALSVYMIWPGEFSNFTVGEKISSSIRSKTRIHRDGGSGQKKFRVKQTGRARYLDHKGWLQRYYDKIQNLLANDLFSTLRISSYLSIIKIATFYVSMVGALLLSVASIFLKPPSMYPDLFALLVSIYSCLHFVGFFVYFNLKQINGLQRHSGKSKSH